MALYRKRPVVVEAFQIVPAWFAIGYPGCEKADGIVLDLDEQCVYIETLEGRMRGNLWDWVIIGVNGEKYPCKPDIFEKTYEPAGD